MVFCLSVRFPALPPVALQHREWVGAGYDEAFIKDYLGSEADSYNHPNAAIEPRIPGIFQYYSVAEDELAKIYAGQYGSAQEGADAIAAAWEKITDQIGRDSQIKLYKASLGLGDLESRPRQRAGPFHRGRPVFVGPKCCSLHGMLGGTCI